MKKKMESDLVTDLLSAFLGNAEQLGLEGGVSVGVDLEDGRRW